MLLTYYITFHYKIGSQHRGHVAPTGQWGTLFRVRLISAEEGEVCSVSGLKALKSRRQDAEYSEVVEEGQGSGRFRRSKRLDCQ